MEPLGLPLADAPARALVRCSDRAWGANTIRTFNGLASHYSAAHEGSLVETLRASLMVTSSWVT